jgi:hypothetical protein
MRLLIPVILLLFLTRCKSSKTEDEWKHFAIKADCKTIESQPFIQADNIERDISKKYISTNDGMRCIEEPLGLNSLRNGYDSLEIRLWGNDSSALTYTDRLIIIKCRKGKNSAEIVHVKYTLHPDSSRAVLDSLIGRRKELGEPHSGWKDFYQKLENLGVYNLPDFEKSTNYPVDTDSGGYSIEFATKTKYRRYGYPSPKGQQTDDAKKFVRIIEFVESEFDVSNLSMPLTQAM